MEVEDTEDEVSCVLSHLHWPGSYSSCPDVSTSALPSTSQCLEGRGDQEHQEQPSND